MTRNEEKMSKSEPKLIPTLLNNPIIVVMTGVVGCSKPKRDFS